MLDSENVRVALTGAVYSAPKGTTAPTNSTTNWAVGWVDLGYVSEDGITESYSDDNTTIKAWQGGATVRSMITSSEATFAFTLLETKGAVLERYHKGASVTGNGATPTGAVLNVSSATADERAWGFDVVDGTNHIRIVVPRGEVTERGEIVYRNNEPVSYSLTITAYPDDDGNVAIKYANDLAWVA